MMAMSPCRSITNGWLVGSAMVFVAPAKDWEILLSTYRRGYRQSSRIDRSAREFLPRRTRHVSKTEVGEGTTCRRPEPHAATRQRRITDAAHEDVIDEQLQRG